ncbi:MAG: hypothetical protein AB7K24_25580 [Gemmataceae bacterium]
MLEKIQRRLTLRDLFTHAEKYTQDLGKHYQSAVWGSVSQVRELSRPVRKNTEYPTMVAFRNSLEQLRTQAAEFEELMAYLDGRYQEILDHARKDEE